MQYESRELVITVRLEGDEVDNLERGKQQSGIRTNAELVRFLLKQYTAGNL